MARARKKAGAGAPLRERDGNQSRLTGFGFLTKDQREQPRLTGFGFGFLRTSDETNHREDETQQDNKENQPGVLVEENGLQEDSKDNEPGVFIGEDEIQEDQKENGPGSILAEPESKQTRQRKKKKKKVLLKMTR